MKPRIIFRTHYQVDEPKYFGYLIQLCTSPIRSSYRETVAKCLSAEIQKRGRKFNEAAARYAIDVGKELAIITENHVWTNLGYLVELVADATQSSADDQFELTLQEKLLYLPVFLAGDGAVLLWLVDYILAHHYLPNSTEARNELAQEMFVELYQAYLSVTADTVERVRLRQNIDNLLRQNYTGNTGNHKLFLHAHLLHRTGIIDLKSTQSREYRLSNDRTHRERAIKLSKAITDLEALETAVQSQRLIEIAAEVLGVEYVMWDQAKQYLTIRLLTEIYRQVLAHGAPSCPLTTLISAIQIKLLAGNVLITYNTAYDFIVDLQQNQSRDVRFHVDRRGKPAYLRLSEEFINSVTNGKEDRYW